MDVSTARFTDKLTITQMSGISPVPSDRTLALVLIEGLFPEKTWNLWQGLLTPPLGWEVCDGAALSSGVEGSQGNTSPLAFSSALPVKLGIVREQLGASPHFTQQ